MPRALSPLIAALLIAAAVLLAPLRALAQDQASLVADSVSIAGDSRLIAEGAVEVFYKGSRLRASRIVFDRASDTLTIDGPIHLTDASGTVILADSAALSRDMRDGILTSARMVLNDQLQLAANSMSRIAGRYTRLDKVVASSCQVCPSNPVPLWEIRAREVLHDQDTHRLTFTGAQFRVAGVPVFYLPRLRIPDPTVTRATGFMMPSMRTSSLLGPGLRLPYFIAIDDSRDLTLTPYLSTSKTRTLAFRYRQAFRNGGVVFEGSASRDDIRPGDTRSYLIASGAFLLPRDYTLTFGIQTVSDPAYLLDYGISDDDRLESGIGLTRTRRNEYFGAQISTFHSLRSGDDNAVLPSLVADLTFHRRFRPEILGGEGGFLFQTHSHRRTSDVDFDANGDGVTDGRDLARVTAQLDWRRNWIARNGMVVSGLVALSADMYAIGQDASYPTSITRVMPIGAIELRWPWVKSGGAGQASYVIEPVVQLVWAPNSTRSVPNEDSQLVELDEGNLFSLDRFPGADAREQGLRANIGLGWTRVDADGWSLGVTGGRVLRARNLGQFSAGSGLGGALSDWIVAAQFETADGLALTNRAVFGDDLAVTKDELRLALTGDRLSLATSYIWMVADPSENRPTSTSEVKFDAGWQLTDGWRGTATGRYDFAAQQATRAGVGLEYRNECVALDLSLSRRYTSSTTVTPSTSFELSVVLNGFGAGADGRKYRRTCGL